MSRRLMSPRFALLMALGLALGAPAHEALAQTIPSAYSESPTAWYLVRNDMVDYFNTSITNTWRTNETCSDSDAFSVASYNIWHDVTGDGFGDEMEGSLGEVVKCADVVLFQEAWDYDDIIDDGPRGDMAARGYTLLLPQSSYCENFGVEKDCTGLVMFYKSGTSLVKRFTIEYFDSLTGWDAYKGKGVWGAIFAKDGKYYYVFTTHLNYGTYGHRESSVQDGTITSDQARIVNMMELRGYVRRMVQENRGSYPPAAVLVGGDFNADFDKYNMNSAGRTLLSQSGASGTFLDPVDFRLTGAQIGRLEVSDSFKSNWPHQSTDNVDTGPNMYATGNRGDYDTILVGNPGELGTCHPSVLAYSGWAPAWYSHSGRRIWPSTTHSDHYGRYIKVHASCGERSTLVLQNESTQRISSWSMWWHWSMPGGVIREGSAEVSPSLAPGWQVVGTGDFNEDKQNDLVLQNAWTRTVALWMMSGTNVIGYPEVSTVPAEGWNVVGAGDFNHDARADLVLQNQWTGRIAVWLMNGPGVWAAPEVSNTPEAGWRVAGVGDLDMDGDADLALQNTTTRQICGWQLEGMNVSSWFCPNEVPAEGWRMTGLGDLTDDGRNDIVLQNPSTGEIGVWVLAQGMNSLYVYAQLSVTSSPGPSWRVAGAF